MQHINSILIYTDGEVMGDGIIRLPLMAALRAHVPDAKITRLVGGASVYDGVLSDLAASYFDEMIPAPAVGLSALITGPTMLSRRKFDIVIDTQRNIKRSLWLKRIPHRRFVSSAAGYMLSDVHPHKRVKSPRMIDQMVDLFSLAIDQSLELAPLQLQEAKWHDSAREVLPDGQKYLGFIVGAGHRDKCWPEQNFITLAQQFRSDGFVPVVILGPAEMDKAQFLKQAMPYALFPMQTPSSIETSNPCFTVALAARLTAAIANDSGGGHLLAAGGCPLVSLFRSSSVRSKFTPSTKHVIALAPEDYHGEGMASIPLEAAQTALKELIASVRRGTNQP